MASHIGRRKFLATLLSGAAASLAGSPFAVARQAAMPLIGFVNAGSAKGGYARPVSAFRQGLSETGYVEGRNVAIEWRWAEGQYDRLPALIADLVHSKVKVIVATGTSAALPAKAAITTIPIVFTTAADPVHLGLVGSLGRPGGNVTGATQLNVEVAPKRLELLHEAIPTATAVAVLLNPSNPNGELTWRRLQPAAVALKPSSNLIKRSARVAAERVFQQPSVTIPLTIKTQPKSLSENIRRDYKVFGA
jgi:putative tryptophan/tyrosine transport system substrate-binding protein